MVALFVALAGAGVAASTAFVRSIKPIALVTGSVGADGKVTGAGLTGGRVSQGEYVITVRGDSFSRSSALWPHMHASITPAITINGSGLRSAPPHCGVASEDISSNGGGTAYVICYSLNGVVWEQQDASFDLTLAGPSR